MLVTYTLQHSGLYLYSVLVLLTIQVQSDSSNYNEAQATFERHQVWRVTPTTEEQLSLLQRIAIDDRLDFWKQPHNLYQDVDLRVPFAIQSHVMKRLRKYGLQITVLIQDVQRAIDEELESMHNQPSKRDLNALQDRVLTSFSSHDQINLWLDSTATLCGSRCSIHNIGYTGEGRQLKVMKISGERQRNKGAIWIDGGIHGREWISPTTAVNIINKLILEFSTDRCVRHLVENFDWYILPVANPDGYEYSRARNRMWRKNRKVSEAPRRPWWTMYYYGSNYKYCYGVDLNRNFGFRWGETGTSSNPCSDIYGGPHAFSEPEARAVQNFTMHLHSDNELKVYLSLHAYGQYWLYSWGYTRQLPSDHVALEQVARAAADAIYIASNRRTRYTVGAAARTLYASSGASDDWAKGELGVKYAFTLELPPSDSNIQGNGFLIPASAIPAVVQETWPGIKAMAAMALKKEKPSHSRHDFCG